MFFLIGSQKFWTLQDEIDPETFWGGFLLSLRYQEM